MKHVLRSLGFISGLVALLLIGGQAGAASKNCSDKDLTGDYMFDEVEIISEGTTTIRYCQTAGTVSFDGVGGLTTTAMIRCDGGTAVPSSPTAHYYSVNPDCSFLASDKEDLSNPSHCQLLDGGRAVICDGTTKTDPASLIFHVVAMKR